MILPNFCQDFKRIDNRKSYVNVEVKLLAFGYSLSATSDVDELPGAC